EAVELVGATDLAAVALDKARRRLLFGAQIEIAEIDAVADILVAAKEIVRRIARRPRAAGFSDAAHFPTARRANARLRWRRRRRVVEDAVGTALRLLVGVEDDAPAAGEAQRRRARQLGIEAGTRIGVRRRRADG